MYDGWYPRHMIKCIALYIPDILCEAGDLIGTIKKKPEKKWKYCGHCQEYLALAVYKRYKADYCDSANRSWRSDVHMYDESRDAEDDNIIKSSM